MRTGSDTKARIESVAMRLFVERGVAETSIRDIARGAGVAEGALYRHHAGKDELVWSLFHKGYTDFATVLDQLQRDEGDTRGKLAAMIGGFCRLFDEDRTLFSFLLLVQHGQLGKIPAEAQTPIMVVRCVMVEAMASGEIPDGDPDLLTAMVVGIVLQTATFAVYGSITAPLGDLAGTLTAACWAAVTHHHQSRNSSAR